MNPSSLSSLTPAAQKRLTESLAPPALAECHRTPSDLARHFINMSLRETQADEATIWLVNEEESHLHPVFNTGPNAAEILSRHKQPLEEGLIGMVFVNGQSLVENDVHLNENQSKRLDRMLGLQTRSLIAVPYHLFDRRQGVVSFVQLSSSEPREAEPQRGFNPGHLEEAENLVALIAQLTECSVMRHTLGCSDRP